MKDRFLWFATTLLVACLLSTARPAFAGSALSGKVIVVDPGHGGRDPGATANGLREKDVTLTIGLQLKALLEAQGAKVIMTRTSDTALGPNTDADLQARVNLAQQAHASAFVSIHGNETADPGYAGATTYYGTECGYLNGVRLSPADVGHSYALAARVQAALVQRTREVDRGTKSMPFWVLGEHGMPSILVETGFLSNAAEAAKLANPAYQHVIADAISDGLATYFGSSEATGQPSAPADASRSCSAAGPAPQPSTERWVQTFLPAPLLSGPDAHAKQFAVLGPFSYLKVLDQKNEYFHVLNPLTNGPGYVEAKKVGPSGPPPPKPPVSAFQTFWVENFHPVQLWSAATGKAISFGMLPPWHFFQVVAPSAGPRFLVKVDTTGNVAYVDRADVGPSGPPAPAKRPGFPSNAALASQAAHPPASSARIVVQPGETLAAIAARYHTTVAQLVALNGLPSPDRLIAGQSLVLAASASQAAPPPGSSARIVVQPGETLAAIAARYHTTVAQLVALNGLPSPDRLIAGQSLVLPL